MSNVLNLQLRFGRDDFSSESWTGSDYFDSISRGHPFKLSETINCFFLSLGFLPRT